MGAEVVEECPHCGFKHPLTRIPGMTVPYEPSKCVKVLSDQVTLLTMALGAVLGGIQGMKSKFFCPWCRSTFETPQDLVTHIKNNPGK